MSISICKTHNTCHYQRNCYNPEFSNSLVTYMMDSIKTHIILKRITKKYRTNNSLTKHFLPIQDGVVFTRILKWCWDISLIRYGVSYGALLLQLWWRWVHGMMCEINKKGMLTSSNGNIFLVTVHRSLVNSSHKGQWRAALIFSLICAWMNG